MKQLLICLLLSFELLNVSAFSRAGHHVHLYDYGNRLIKYADGLKWQEKLLGFHKENTQLPLSEEKSSLIGSLLVLQHHSVYTLGTGSNSESGPFAAVDNEGNKLDYELFPTNRAGQATYHGPGQLVLYPILDLVSAYVVQFVLYIISNFFFLSSEFLSK
jgi:lipoate-protein ligase B